MDWFSDIPIWVYALIVGAGGVAVWYVIVKVFLRL